jgi:hypothetical protein
LGDEIIATKYYDLNNGYAVDYTVLHN